MELWANYRVRWDFLYRLIGQVPSDPEVVEAWTKARRAKVTPPGGRSIAEINAEVLDSLAEPEEESQLLVFQRHEGQLVMRAATVRAHLKDCARVLSAQYIGRIQGERAFSTRIINGVYPAEDRYWIPILRPDGEPVTKHDGEQDKAVHVTGPRGQKMNALKTFEYVAPARMDFVLRVLGGDRTASAKDLETLMTYGGIHGYAGERGDGEGKYVATIEKV